MEETLQNKGTTQCIGLPPASPRSHPPDGPKAGHALTLKPDHLSGSDHHSYRRGLTELLHLAEGSAYNERASAAEHLIHQSGPSEDEALVPLFELERKNMRLKRAVSELLSGLLIDRAPIASKAKSIGLELSRQQSERNKLVADPSSRGLDQLSNVLSIWDLG